MTGALPDNKNQKGGMQMLDLVLVTIVCWSLAAWLFWRWDIGGYRSDFQMRSKKEEKTSRK
jgi:hypothetical protein